MKKRLLILLLFYLFIQNSYSQQLEWIKTYPQIGADALKDSSDNIVMLSVGGGWFNLLKYKNNGALIWNKSYSYSISTNLSFMATDKKSNLYIASTSNEGFYITFKIDSSGNQQWVRYYSVGVFNRPKAITIDTSDNIIVTGISQLQAYNYLTIKYNPQGDSLWTARYSGINPAAASSPNSVCTDIQGNVYVTGAGSDGMPSGQQWATIKYNSIGIQQWVRTYYGPYGQYAYPAYCVKTDNQGNAYIAGNARILFDLTGFGTIKYNSSGDSLWTRVYTEPNIVQASNYAYDLEIDNFENVYVFGRGHESSINPYGAYTVVKYNSNGNLIWVTNDTLGSTPSKITLKDNKYVYITGGKGIKMYTVGYDSSGNKIFTSSYPPYINPQKYYTGQKVFFDKSNGLFIFGSCVDTLVLMKYSLPTNIRSISKNVSEKYELFQNYPNPFNPTTNIKYQISNGFRTTLHGGRNDRLNVTLKIYNILGKEIATLVNEKQSPGTYEVSFDGTNYPSGVYFYKLVVGDSEAGSGQVFTETKRMVLIK